MPKTIQIIIQVILSITIYELIKYIVSELLIILTANDDIDTLCDYDMQYQQDLNALNEYSRKQK